MNEGLIRDLAITGGIYDCICDPYDKLKNGDHYSSVMIDLERFAEVIVRQMLEITDAHTEVFQTDRDRAVIEHIKKSVRQHFGVEE